MLFRTAVALALFGISIGHPTELQQRNATISERPWHASIAVRWDPDTTLADLVCGAIISPQVIVTTANLVSQSPIDSIVVRVGADEAASGGQLVAIDRIIAHPEFNADTLANDIALVFLSAPLNYTANVSAIALPSTDAVRLPEGTNVSFSGWRFDASTEVGASGSLQIVNQVIWNHDACIRHYRNETSTVTNNNICAASEIEDSGPCTVGADLFNRNSCFDIF